MTDTAKPTPGPWYFCSYPAGNGGFVYAGGPGGPSICDMSQYELPEQNGEFIAEAGTVYYETGLTPRQLLDLLQKFLDAAVYVNNPRDPIGFAVDVGKFKAVVRETKAALAKHGEGV